MLVLTRKPGESIIVGDNIKITLVNIAPGRVRIGIDAPSHVSIQREELVADAPTHAPSPDAVISEAPTLHNRLLDKFPAPAVPPAAPAADSSAAFENRLKKFRRKPR